jgi:hypothetical protein
MLRFDEVRSGNSPGKQLDLLGYLETAAPPHPAISFVRASVVYLGLLPLRDGVL